MGGGVNMAISIKELLDLMEKETGRRPVEGRDYTVIADNPARLELILHTTDEGDKTIVFRRLKRVMGEG